MIDSKQPVTIVPKERIHSLDAMRGFALLGILMLHSIQNFDLSFTQKIESPFWQWLDTAIRDSMYFLFDGKSYAIFSFLFGLSFFIQMDSQAEKGNDFRLRYVWRLCILFVFGYLNGLIYSGELFTIYAIMGLTIIPFYKIPSKTLAVISILLLIQIPLILDFILLLIGKEPVTTISFGPKMSLWFREGREIYMNGTIWDVIKHNTVKGHIAIASWFVGSYRYVQMIGLLIAGMLFGRIGMYKDAGKMVYWSKKILPYATGVFIVFHIMSTFVLPMFELERLTLRTGTRLFDFFRNTGMMMMYMCGFTLLYYRTKVWRKFLDKIAPVGRMSVTNYIMQSMIGVFLCYGFGAGFAFKGNLVSLAMGLTMCVVQVLFSNWWINRYYYGPFEWLWRTLTWFKKVPLRRIVS